MRLLQILTLLALPFFGLAQTFTIGSNGDYNSFNAAVSDLPNLSQFQDSIVFKIKAGTYLEKVNLSTPSFIPQGINKPFIIFKGDDGVHKNNIILETEDDSLLVLNGADWFKFQGFTINNTVYNGNGSAVYLKNGADNNLFVDMVIKTGSLDAGFCVDIDEFSSNINNVFNRVYTWGSVSYNVGRSEDLTPPSTRNNLYRSSLKIYNSKLGTSAGVYAYNTDDLILSNDTLACRVYGFRGSYNNNLQIENCFIDASFVGLELLDCNNGTSIFNNLIKTGGTYGPYQSNVQHEVVKLTSCDVDFHYNTCYGSNDNKTDLFILINDSSSSIQGNIFSSNGKGGKFISIMNPNNTIIDFNNYNTYDSNYDWGNFDAISLSKHHTNLGVNSIFVDPQFEDISGFYNPIVINDSLVDGTDLRVNEDITGYLRKPTPTIGCWEIRNSVNNKNQLSNAKMLVFPNPTNGNISIKGISNNSTIIITDIQGKQIQKLNNYSGENILLKNVNTGIYSIMIIDENGQKLNSQLVVK